MHHSGEVDALPMVLFGIHAHQPHPHHRHNADDLFDSDFVPHRKTTTTATTSSTTSSSSLAVPSAAYPLQRHVSDSVLEDRHKVQIDAPDVDALRRMQDELDKSAPGVPLPASPACSSNSPTTPAASAAVSSPESPSRPTVPNWLARSPPTPSTFTPSPLPFASTPSPCSSTLTASSGLPRPVLGQPPSSDFSSSSTANETETEVSSYVESCERSAARLSLSPTLGRPAGTESPPSPTSSSATSTSTSSNARKVRWADQQGGRLARTRTFSHTAPPSDTLRGAHLPSHAPSLQFVHKDHLPHCEDDLVSSVCRSQVRLESVVLRAPLAFLTARVANICPEKTVFFRITTDNWASFRDVLCTYAPGGTDSRTDRFMCSFNVPMNCDEPIDFCLCFRTEAGEWWDSNDGHNYRIERAKYQQRSTEKTNKFMPAPPAMNDQWSRYWKM